ncbi:IclR family transcriptional regulator [soil metagenome]
MIRGRASSLRRALVLLEVLGSDDVVAAGGSAVGQLAAATGREKSQVSRMLATLAEAGFADRDPGTRRYRLGWQLFALAARSGNQRLLVAAAPVLTRLTRETGESAHLSVLCGDGVLTLLTQSPPRALQAVSWVGRLIPASTTSSGRALLLDHDREQLAAVFGAAPLPRPTTKAPANLDGLLDRILVARARGYAWAEEESEPGLAAYAAPVRDGGGRIVAALNVSGPMFRLGRSADTGELVVAAAIDLSERLRRPAAATELAEALA